MAVRTIEWRNGSIVMMGQRLLPTREVYHVTPSSPRRSSPIGAWRPPYERGLARRAPVDARRAPRAGREDASSVTARPSR